MLTVTVSQLNRYMKAVVEEDRKLRGIFVKGEISGYTRNFRQGHLYFSLRDETSSVKAVMFKSNAEDLKFEPENGMMVLVQANLGVFERDGVYQLYVTDIQPDGAGALLVAQEQLKAKLSAQGLFDARYKKPLPLYPSRIGVVTSETGAVFSDIINILTRRFPLCTVVISPAVVQGRDAPASLIKSLSALEEKGGCDVIIIARGGGSQEDLWCFNDESLARAVFAAKTPVVSAVGHETDFTICDLVADLRAPTPSAAAELCAPSIHEIRQKLSDAERTLRYLGSAKLDALTRRMDRLKQKQSLRTPAAYLVKNKERLDFLTRLLYNKSHVILSDFSSKLAVRAARLDALNPLSVLTRGYSVTFRAEETITCVKSLHLGDKLVVQFSDGVAHTVVESIGEGALYGDKKTTDL